MLLSGAGLQFIGPLAGWDNLHTTYGATGNGATDDTAAFQTALNDIGTSGHSNVLYIPAGTYKITSTLTCSNKVDTSGVEILGASPGTVTIEWAGPSGGTMLDFNTLTESEFGRFTLQGNGTAGVGLWEWCQAGGANGNDTTDAVFENMAIGLRYCDHPGENSDYPNCVLDSPVERCQFLNCTAAGVDINNPNSLNDSVQYCLFDDCGTGLTDGLTGTSMHWPAHRGMAISRPTTMCLLIRPSRT